MSMHIHGHWSKGLSMRICPQHLGTRAILDDFTFACINAHAHVSPAGYIRSNSTPTQVSLHTPIHMPKHMCAWQVSSLPNCAACRSAPSRVRCVRGPAALTDSAIQTRRCVSNGTAAPPGEPIKPDSIPLKKFLDLFTQSLGCVLLT